MRSALLFIVMTFVLASSPAQANILIEPYGGIQPGGELSLKSFTNPASGSFTSFVYGGRLGLDMKGLFLGGEYLASQAVKVKFGGPNPWGTADTTAMMNNADLGGFIGYEFMQSAVRLYGTFFASSDAHLTNPGATQYADMELKGYGYKIELDSRLMKNVSLGVSYYHQVYMKWVDNSTKAATPAVPVNTQHSLLVLLTLPIEF